MNTVVSSIETLYSTYARFTDGFSLKTFEMKLDKNK